MRSYNTSLTSVSRPSVSRHLAVQQHPTFIPFGKKLFPTLICTIKKNRCGAAVAGIFCGRTAAAAPPPPPSAFPRLNHATTLSSTLGNSYHLASCRCYAKRSLSHTLSLADSILALISFITRNFLFKSLTPNQCVLIAMPQPHQFTISQF